MVIIYMKKRKMKKEGKHYQSPATRGLTSSTMDSSVKRHRHLLYPDFSPPVSPFGLVHKVHKAVVLIVVHVGPHSRYKIVSNEYRQVSEPIDLSSIPQVPITHYTTYSFPPHDY